MFRELLALYGLDEKSCQISPYGNGLINHSWKITTSGKEFLFQRINRSVFKMPRDIMENLELLSNYFKKAYPDYLFVAPLTTLNGKNFIKDPSNQVYRLFPFITGSTTFETVSHPSLAYEAAGQFGKFTQLLAGFDADRLHIPLRDFHNLTLRYEQFELSLKKAKKDRLDSAIQEIEFLQSNYPIVEIFEEIREQKNIPLRVIHHDTKISNVLFNKKTEKGICVIDLDTVMPGYFISDLGDMMRTYLSPFPEDEPDLQKIEIREDYFRQIVLGYGTKMKSVLTAEETSLFIYAGKFAIFIQALRFLTDHLNGDRYYSIKYQGHNLIRTKNQNELLRKYLDKEPRLDEILKTSL